jgi:SAM-dependent methyltransferase
MLPLSDRTTCAASPVGSATMRLQVETCPICDSVGQPVGTKVSNFSGLEFHFQHCETCGYTFVTDPRVDFDKLYDDEYYAGRGADDNVEYLREMTQPETLRVYEWRGVHETVGRLIGDTNVRWLDYGCGLGGLVTYLRKHGVAEAYGFDEGFSAKWMSEHEVPSISREQLPELRGTFDVVTAIEVIEHVTDPIGLMKEIAALLRPGGLFFLTTGNAEPHQHRFLKWPYVNPDVHVGYFQPRTLSRVYERVGMRAAFPGYLSGFDDIIRYKVLKALNRTRRGGLERVLPWPLLSRVVDRRHHVTAHPVAWKQ